LRVGEGSRERRVIRSINTRNVTSHPAEKLTPDSLDWQEGEGGG
jgi:hypothetical protein